MNNKKRILVLSAVLVLSNIAVGADLAAGKATSAKCVGCHGANGISINATIPNLAGKDIAFLSERMIGFRDGSVPSPIMNGMAGGLSDSDIENLASYYNSLSGQ